MDLVKEITQNKFLLVLLSEGQYKKKMLDMIDQVKKTKSRICYVCLSAPYKDVVEEFKQSGIDTSNFFLHLVTQEVVREPYYGAAFLIYQEGCYGIKYKHAAVLLLYRPRDCPLYLIKGVGA